MAKPHAGFPSEPGSTSPCGWSWFRNYQVTGEIPKTGGFGKQHDVNLQPIVMQNDLPEEYGRDNATERNVIDKIEQRIIKTAERVQQYQEWLKDKDIDVLNWLLSHASAHVEAVDEIYDRWKERNGGSYPLPKPDAIDFIPQCVGKNFNELVEVKTEDGRGTSTWMRCPSMWELDERKKDRRRIKDRILDALHHVRCAEFGVFRLMLYRKALEEWKQQHPTDDLATPHVVGQPQVGGLGTPHVPPPFGGVGGGLKVPAMPPENPGDVLLPDPKTLPPPDQLPPDEEPQPLPTDGAPGPAAPTASEGSGTLGKVVMAGAAGLIAWLVLK